MTLDKLALMIGEGFNGVDEKFVQVNKRFDDVDKKFEQVTQKINNINLNIVDVVRTEDFNKLESRIANIEEALDLKLKKA